MDSRKNSNRSNARLVALILFALGGVDALGQATLWQHYGDTPNSRIGYCVEVLGDLDGDSRDDLLIGRLFYGPGFVVSGASGQQLYSLQGTALNHGAQHAARLDDIDNDGVTDFVVGGRDQTGLWNTGAVAAFSGADGSVIYSFGELPNTLSRTYDLDGDGYRDFLVTRVNASTRAYSGRTGALIFDWPAPNPPSGTSVSRLLVDGFQGSGGPRVLTACLPITLPIQYCASYPDDNAPIAIADRQQGPGTPDEHLRIYNFRHASGWYLQRSISITSPTGIAGMPKHPLGVSWQWPVAVTTLSSTTLYDIATGNPLWTYPAGGQLVRYAGDVDADGVDDLIVSGGAAGTFVLSIADGTVVPGPGSGSWPVTDSLYPIGGAVAANLDGAAGKEIIVGQPRFDSGRGRVMAFAGPRGISQAAALVFGPGCGAGSLASPQLVMSQPVLGQVLTKDLTGASPGAGGVLGIMPGPAQASNLPCGGFLDLLQTQVLATFHTDSSGAWSAASYLPYHLSLAGLVVTEQAFVWTPQGVVSSNAIQLTLGI